MSIAEDIQEVKEELLYAEQMVNLWHRDNVHGLSEVAWQREWRQEVANIKKNLNKQKSRI